MGERWRASDVDLADLLWEEHPGQRMLRIVAGAVFVVLLISVPAYFILAGPPTASQPAVTQPAITQPATASRTAPATVPEPGRPAGSPSTGPADPTHPYEAPLSAFAVKFGRVVTARTVRDPQWGTHRPAGKYAVIHLSLRNTTRRPVYPPVHLPLVTTAGSTFMPVWEPTFGQTVLVGHGDLGKLKPGATTTVAIVYDVPQHAVVATLSGLRLRRP